MPEINNSAEATYIFEGSSDTFTATSNTFPINFDNSQGLSLTKTANISTFSAGDIITYTIQITNTSSSFLNGVRIIDNIGGGNLAYVLGSATLTSGSNTYPVTPVATNPLTFTLQQLGVGETMKLSYNAQVIFNLPPSVSLITNSVTGIGYPYSGTIKGYTSNTIQKKTDVDFTFTKSSNVTEVGSNQNFSYFLTLENNTSSPATISSITDNLPSNYNLTSVSLKIGSGPEIVLSGTDYLISLSNVLTIPSSSGPFISVPSNGTSVITLTGYFS